MTEISKRDSVRKALQDVLQKLNDRQRSFDKGWKDEEFLEREWNWRKDRSRFIEWLNADKPNLEDKWWIFFRGQGTREFSKKEAAIQKAWEKDIEGIKRKRVFMALKKALECRKQPDDINMRASVVKEYFDALKDLANLDGLDRDEKRVVATEWGPRTVPLSAVAPNVFPFVFSTQTKGEQGKLLLGDVFRIPSKAEPDDYLKICDAYLLLADALERKFGPFPEPDCRIRMTAAWLAEVHNRWSDSH